jgi:hypothetical protein
VKKGKREGRENRKTEGRREGRTDKKKAGGKEHFIGNDRRDRRATPGPESKEGRTEGRKEGRKKGKKEIRKRRKRGRKGGFISTVTNVPQSSLHSCPTPRLPPSAPQLTQTKPPPSPQPHGLPYGEEKRGEETYGLGIVQLGPQVW